MTTNRFYYHMKLFSIIITDVDSQRFFPVLLGILGYKLLKNSLDYEVHLD